MSKWTPLSIPRTPYFTIREDSHFGVWQQQTKKLCHDERFLNIVLPKIRPNSVVIDVGAYNGDHSIAYAKSAAKVFAFEPQILPFLNLCTNIFMGRHDNILPICKGLGEKRKMAKINPLAEGNLGATWICDQGYDIEIVPLDKYNLNDISYIKIDVEGYEPFVLQGAKETLKRCKPILALEINPGALGRIGLSEDLLWKELEILKPYEKFAISGIPNSAQWDCLIVPQ